MTAEQAARARVEQEFDRARQATRFDAYFRALATDERRRPSVSRSRFSPGRRRGLVVRSIPLGLLAKKLLLLRERYPDMQWDVLTTESSADQVRRTPLVTEVHTYADGRLSLRAVGRERLTELHDRSYDLVVVPYADDIGSEAAVHLGLGHGRKLRSIHDHVRAALARWNRAHS